MSGNFNLSKKPCERVFFGNRNSINLSADKQCTALLPVNLIGRNFNTFFFFALCIDVENNPNLDYVRNYKHAHV